ncbi:MAG TPA: VanZ family protein [Gemmatimonadales bacterium]|nr:VanZ family protein [Gemmatimonadales bacterium]
MVPDSHSPAPRWRAVAVTVLAVAFVARLTLTSAPVDPDETRAGFLCMTGCNNEGGRDFLSNILLFLPLGWALSYWLRPKPAVLACLAATIAIETLQGTVLTGRDSSLRDILSNALGGGLGVWLYRDWRRFRWPGARESVILGCMAALVWSAVLGFTALGTRLAPSANPYYGLWAKAYGHYTQYTGRILALQVDGTAPPDGFFQDPAPLRRSMTADTFLVAARVVSGAPPRRTAPIYAVVDSAHDEQVLLAQDRNALVLQLRTRFERWEFRALIARLPLFAGRAPGDTVSIVAGRTRTAWVIRSTSRDGESEVTLPMTVGWGWASMLPFRYAVWDEWLLLNPVWLAGLMFPVGYWFARSAPGTGIVVTALILVTGLAGIPLATGAAATSGGEWVGAALGALLGWVAGAGSRRHGRWIHGERR